MWIVAKIKNKELDIFKDNLIKKFDKNIKFYYPKIKYIKYFGNKIKKFEKRVLENYVFCYHEEFNKVSSVNKAKFLKGLEYFLNGHNQNQNEIISFIEYCKAYENEEGYLKPVFFKAMITKKAKFISGPFTNIIFEILERKKNNLKILIGNIVTTISDKKNYLYRPI
tara:strand:- start:235 stop:735 length:501 start_codon:yes stop_codon:yes gene_type:complete